MFKKVNLNEIIKILPVLAGIGFIIALVALVSKSIFAANMIMLLIGITIAYIGGGIIPRAMLPGIIQQISNYMPGKYFIESIAMSLFGL